MPELNVGEKVRLTKIPPFIKTADPMPMMRSSTFLQVGQEGQIIDRRPANYWAVRFAQGAYLIDDEYLESCS